MGYAITNGSKFICVDARNRVDSTKNIHSAKNFDTYIKANNFAACLPALYRNAGYEVVNDDVFLDSQCEQDIERDGNTQVDDDDRRGPSIPDINEEYLDLDFLLANVQVFEEFMRDFQRQKRAIELEHARMDRVITDLVHAAELYDLDARRGYMLYKMLREARRRRRACKDAEFVLCLLDDHVDDAILNCENTRAIEGLYHRQYRPREIKNLEEIFQSKNIRSSKQPEEIEDENIN